MQLGDWIEFQTIVVREPSADGSQPARQTFARPRTGMIVGQQYVYDMQQGTPPILSRPQPVLIVAVSLHRRYRVFAADARPGTAPPPKRQRQRRAATSKQPPMTDTSDLALLVADEISRRMAAGVYFTAYDITVALRAAHPDADIHHADVRRIVHEQMDTLVAGGMYERETAEFNRRSSHPLRAGARADGASGVGGLIYSVEQHDDRRARHGVPLPSNERTRTA